MSAIDSCSDTRSDRPLRAGGLRSRRERVVQTLWFEGVGLLLVAPLYATVMRATAGESVALVAVVSLVVMGWAALFNTLFDRIEWRLTQRVASARPTGLRVLHAVTFEATAMAVTVPVIWAMSHMTWLQALQVDVALTLTYMVYGYAFHRVYDRWRPVRPTAAAPEA